ncbi:MAG: hypothetical protein AAGB11_14225 [Pseudomonadota bacterium]
MSPMETTAVRFGGVVEDGAVALALKERANILAMTEDAQAAVLTPREVGGFPHDMRAALAARIASLHQEEALAAAHRERIGDGGYAPLSDPAHPGTTPRDTALLSFVDKAAASPKDMASGDISALQASGMGDADIVRLCEIIAFLAYQLRVIAGLRLMGGAP